MKRYTLTILLGLFIAAGIGTYYVYGSADHLPEYKLSTIQGNAEEGSVVELSGYFGARMRSESLTVNDDGTRYNSRQSLFSQYFLNARSYFYRSSDMVNLIKDHRNFMRGKGSQAGFYKDVKWLIYAYTSLRNDGTSKREVILNIDLLNLASGEVKNYQTTENTASTNVIYDVQRVGNEIHILILRQEPAMAASRITGPPNEYYDYVVDINNGKLIRNEKLKYNISAKKDVELQAQAITNDTPSAPDDNVILEVEEEKITQKENNSYSGVTIARHLYSYSYKTGKLTALPDSLTQSGPKTNPSYSLNGNMLDLLISDNTKITLSRYNLETGQEEMVAESITAQQLGADLIKIGYTLIQHSRVYVLLQKNKVPMVVVLDASNGALLYKGQVTFEGPESEANEQMKNLQLPQMNIKI